MKISNSNISDHPGIKLQLTEKKEHKRITGTLCRMVRVMGCIVLSSSLSLSQQNFWQSSSGIPWEQNIRTITTSSSGSVFAGTGYAGIYRSTDNGVTWAAANTGLTESHIYSFTVNDSGHIFAGTGGGGVFRSLDEGTHWTAINTGVTSGDIPSMACGINGFVFAGTSGSCVLRSTNNGTSWSPTNSGPNPPTSARAVIATPHNLIVGAYGGGVFSSEDYYGNWNFVALSGQDITSMVGNSAGVLFACAYGGNVYRSTDEGNSWTQINTGLVSSNVHGLAINAEDQLFAGTDHGVFTSTNSGDNWVQINSGLPEVYIHSIAINSLGYVFAGANVGGVYRSVNTTTSVSLHDGLIPQTFVLSQNYPNPFNPSTTIRYALSQRSTVRLTVFNTLGQIVATLVDGMQEAGFRSVEFNGNNLSSGVYYYRLQAGEFVQTKKLLLLR